MDKTTKSLLIFVVILIGFFVIISAISSDVDAQKSGFNETQEQEILRIVNIEDTRQNQYQKVQDWYENHDGSQYKTLYERAGQYLNQNQPDKNNQNQFSEYEDVNPQNFDDLAITDYDLDGGNSTIQYDTDGKENVETSIIVIGISGSEVPQIVQISRDLTGQGNITIPLSEDSQSTIAVIQVGKQFTVLSQSPADIIQNLTAGLLFFSGLGVAIGMTIYAIHFLIFRRSLIENYTATSGLLTQSISGSMKPIKTGNVKDEELNNDDITAIFGRYFSLRRAFIILMVIILGLYISQFIFGLSLPLPEFDDRAMITAGFTMGSYIFVAPLFIDPVLRALFNPDLEFVEKVDETGQVCKRYVAKRGLMDDRYEAEGVQKIQAENGNPLYLVSEIDRENMTAKGAFQWSLSDDVLDDLELVSNYEYDISMTVDDDIYEAKIEWVEDEINIPDDSLKPSEWTEPSISYSENRGHREDTYSYTIQGDILEISGVKSGGIGGEISIQTVVKVDGKAVIYLSLNNENDYSDVVVGNGENKRNINILEILDNSTKAQIVLVDMLQSADAGQKIRGNLPVIIQKLEMQASKDVAEGLHKVLGGTSGEKVLSDMIDSYDMYQKEIENEISEEVKEALEKEQNIDEDIEKIDSQETTNDSGGDNE